MAIIIPKMPNIFPSLDDSGLDKPLKANIKKSAEIEGVLNQKTLSIEEGASLKIKTETYK